MQVNKLLRTYRNYLKDCKYKRNGIIEKCIWNCLTFYNCIKCPCADLTHDLLEGVCRYDMANILQKFIFQLKIFSIKTLNLRLSQFENIFGDRNKVPQFIEKSILKKQLILSSSEMFYLVEFFGVILGDLVLKSNRESLKYWKLYLNLRNILEIVMSPSCAEDSDLDKLKLLISQHHKKFLKLFPKQNLT